MDGGRGGTNGPDAHHHTTTKDNSAFASPLTAWALAVPLAQYSHCSTTGTGLFTTYLFIFIYSGWCRRQHTVCGGPSYLTKQQQQIF